MKSQIDGRRSLGTGAFYLISSRRLVGSTPPQNSNSVLKHVGSGMSLAITVLVCIWLGYLADKKWNIRPWGIVGGAAVGISAGLYNFIREFSNDATDSDKGT